MISLDSWIHYEPQSTKIVIEYVYIFVKLVFELRFNSTLYCSKILLNHGVECQKIVLKKNKDGSRRLVDDQFGNMISHILSIYYFE